MFSLFKNSIIKNAINDFDESFMNFDFKSILSPNYKNFNYDYGSVGSIFLNQADTSSLTNFDSTFIKNIYTAVYNNTPNSKLPTYQGNYPIYNLDSLYTSSDNNWGCFVIPILSSSGVFDSYRVVSIFNPWFILANDYCVAKDTLQGNPALLLSAGCNSGSFQTWLINTKNFSNCNTSFENSPTNLKIAFTGDDKWTTGRPDIISVTDSSGNNFCIAVFQPYSNRDQKISLTGYLVLDPQYENKLYKDNTDINTCDTTTGNITSYPNVIYQGSDAVPQSDADCTSFLNSQSICPYITLDTSMGLNITLPAFSGITDPQNCFNFIKPDSLNTFFRRGIVDTNCSFPDYSVVGKQSYYTLDQYLNSGNIDIPTMMNDPSNLIYADYNGGSPISTKLSSNNTLTINHSYNDWKNGTNTMSNSVSQNIGNTDTRTIRVGCNPDGNNGCKADTPTGGSGAYLKNDQLYAKGSDNYISLSNIDNNIESAWQLGNIRINGLKYNDNATIAFGTDPYSGGAGTSNQLYSLIDTSQVNGMFNSNDGSINNNTMFLTDTDTSTFPNSDQDWTKCGDGYQKVYTSRQTGRTDPYYFNVANVWKSPNSDTPFQAESKFSNYYNPKNINFCAPGTGADQTAGPQSYDNNSLFSQSSLNTDITKDFTQGDVLFKCLSCSEGDTLSGINGYGYCIPPPKNWWYQTKSVDETSNLEYYSANGPWVNYIPDTSSGPYKRIIYLLGPSGTSPGDGWKQVMKSNVPINTDNLYEAVNALSTNGNGNMPTDNIPTQGDKGIICPAPNQLDSTGSSIDRGFSFSNQFTKKGGSTGTDIVTQQDIKNSVPDNPCGWNISDACAEVGNGQGVMLKFLRDTAASGYDSPGETLLLQPNVYSCANNILNGGVNSSGFPGGLFYEDFYDPSCPAGGSDEACGTGPYHINNSSGKAFPFNNQQSIPGATQNIKVVIEDSGNFYIPDNISYTTATGQSYQSGPYGTFPDLTDIVSFISDGSVVCKNTDSPLWATGKLGSNNDYNNNLGYIPSCFNVGYPLVEHTKLGTDGQSYVPTTSADKNTYPNYTADDGIITITYKGQTAKIKNDISIIRDPTSTDNNQTSICFNGVKLSPNGIVKFVPKNVDSGSITPSGSVPQGALDNKMKGLSNPCYNPNYNMDGIIRMNLTNSQMYSANTLYLVISFNNNNMNINSGYYTLLTF
jgi:hypothetical protein